jgi:hypothetical protein
MRAPVQAWFVLVEPRFMSFKGFFCLMTNASTMLRDNGSIISSLLTSTSRLMESDLGLCSTSGNWAINDSLFCYMQVSDFFPLKTSGTGKLGQ